jgi:hypothetical protein
VGEEYRRFTLSDVSHRTAYVLLAAFYPRPADDFYEEAQEKRVWADLYKEEYINVSLMQ